MIVQVIKSVIAENIKKRKETPMTNDMAYEGCPHTNNDDWCLQCQLEYAEWESMVAMDKVEELKQQIKKEKESDNRLTKQRT